MTGVADDTQPSLWQDRVRLDSGFWRSLQQHPVPVREEAIRVIGPRSLAIDVYIWLAYGASLFDEIDPRQPGRPYIPSSALRDVSDVV